MVYFINKEEGAGGHPAARGRRCRFWIYKKMLNTLEARNMSDKIKQDISIGPNLARLRKKAGLSQENAAAKLQLMGFSVSRTMISQMELGQYPIRVSVLLALKEIYQAAFDDFFDGLD